MEFLVWITIPCVDNAHCNDNGLGKNTWTAKEKPERTNHDKR